MRLVPSRPVTIERVRYGERWFPYLFRHTDGSLLLYTQYGHDGNFSPALRVRSADNGLTWGDPVDHVPRQCWSHSFADGELFEIDTYGVQDPADPDVAVYFGAWSRPGVVGDEARKGLVRVRAPSVTGLPLSRMLCGFPSHPWWPLWNGVWGADDVDAEKVMLTGPVFTSGIEVEPGRLVAAAYAAHKESGGKACVVALESTDRGRSWREIAVAMREDSTPEGPDEASLVKLADGRLYLVARTGTVLYQAYSSDGGRTWTPPEPMRLVDQDRAPGWVWPVVKRMEGGALAMVFGRPGKELVIDPSGTGREWRAGVDLNALERESQTFLEVPPERRIRRPHPAVRYWDSSDYIALVTDGPGRLIVVYDVQNYVEHAGAPPVSGVRLVRVRVEG